MSIFLKNLPRLLPQVVQRHYQKIKVAGPTARERRDGPPLAWILGHYYEVENFLFHRLRRGDFVFSPLHKLELQQKDKVRVVWVPDTWDRLVAGCVQDFLTEILRPQYSADLYSFQRGRGAFDAHLKLRQFCYQHKTKKLHISQRDVSKYGDNILAEKLITKIEYRYPDIKQDDVLSRILKQVLEWPVQLPSGEINKMTKGIPAGVPLVPLFENIYLADFDDWVSEQCKTKSIFYGRYGDDVIWASEDVVLTEQITNKFTTYCSEHGLAIKTEKSEDFVLLASHPLKWLGASLSSQGRLVPRHDDLKKFKTDFKKQMNLKYRKCLLLSEMGHGKWWDLWLQQINHELKSMKMQGQDKVVIHIDGDAKFKRLDQWLHEMVVRFLRSKGIKKSMGWKLLREKPLVKLNWQRRKHCVRLKRVST